MESKKINQLATELAPVLSDLTIIGDPTTGISKKITLSQMASLFTGTVEEYPNLASFPLVGTADTIYIALDTNVLYRWDTGLTSYVELSPNIINSLVFNDANGFDGTIALVGSVATLTITTALTTGSVGFIGTSGALLQDNANFFWDDTNNRLGIGTNAPTTAIDTFGSGIITRVNGTSTNNAFIGFASAGSNKWSIGNVQSDHRFRIYNEATTSELVSVLQTGEFGIGIANPTTKLHIDGGASALIANLDANVSVAKSISFRSDNSARFNIEVSGTESGSNAGANLFIRRYSDAGSLIDTPLTITRSTGAATFSSSLTVQSGATIFSTTSDLQLLIGNGSRDLFISGSTVAGTSQMIGIQNISGLNKVNIYDGKLSILSTGQATFSNSITALTATFTDTVGITLTASDSRILGGNTTGRLLLGNSSTSTYAIIYGSAHATLPNAITLVNNNTTSLTLSSTGAATFISTIRSNDTSGLAIGSIAGYRRLQYNIGNTTFGFLTDSNSLANIEAFGASFSNSVYLARPASGSTLLQLSGSAAYGDTSTINFCDGRSFIKSTILVTANGATDLTFGTYNDVAIAQRMKLTANGNLLIGTDSDNGARLQINGGTSGTKFNTFNGNLNVANNTDTLLVSCSAEGGTGSMYLIIAAVGGGGSDVIASGILVTISQGGGTARWAQQSNGANMILSDPSQNGNVYVKQTTGVTKTVNYSVLRIA